MKTQRKIGFGFVLLMLAVSMATFAATEDTAGATSSQVVLVESIAFKITLDEFVAIASAQSPSAQQELIRDTKKREQLLEKIINMNLLAAEAVRRGYNSHPEVIAVKKNRLATLMHTRIEDQIDAYVPNNEDLKTYYDENYDKYNKAEKVRARHILISRKEEAQSLLNQLKKDNASQYDFRKLAKEKSEDELTRAKGGDLAFFSRTDAPEYIDPRVVQAAFQLRSNGALYPQLIETAQGYHLVMRTGYRKAMSVPFEEAKERLVKQVQRQLHKKKVEEALSALQEKYNVELFEENLKHVVIDLTKTTSGPTSSLPQRRRVRR